MAFNIGAILGTLVLDSSKWDNAIKRSKSDMKSFEGAILRNERSIKRFGIALGVAGAAITAVNVKLVKMAASAEESENLFEVSMGGMADSARAWSQQLSKDLGLNQYEIRRTVGLMDVMLKSMGLSEDAAYGMSTSLVQLSQDMASFYNMSPDEAFQKIQAGITGETEPLKRLGIIVNETTVKQWALTNGLIKQGQELSEQQKVLARYGVIMESTKNAQGDLARTIGSTTNQARIFSSITSELAVTLGTALLPAVNSTLVLLNKLLRSVQTFVSTFPNATSAIVIFSASMGILATVAGGVLLILPGLAAAAAAAGTTMLAVAGALTLKFLILASAITAVVLAVQNFDFLKGIFFSFAEGVNQMVASAQEGLAGLMEMLAKLPGPQQAFFQGLATDYQASAIEFKKDADMMGEAAVKAFQGSIDKAGEFANKVNQTGEDIKNGFNGVWDGVAEESAKFYKDSAKDSKNWLVKMKEDFKIFEEMGKRTFNTMADTFSNLFYDSVMGELTSLQEVFASFGRSVIRIIADIVAQWVAMKIMTGIAGVFTGGTAAVAGAGGYEAGTPAGTMDMGTYSKLPSFDTGISNVPYDMVAKIHKGEKVLTAEENQQGGVIQLTIQNAITTESVARAMQSREGRKTIVNVIQADSSINGVTKREVQTR